MIIFFEGQGFFCLQKHNPFYLWFQLGVCVLFPFYLLCYVMLCQRWFVSFCSLCDSSPQGPPTYSTYAGLHSNQIAVKVCYSHCNVP